MKYFSQDGQDRFVADLLNHKKNGVFIDIGAFDGIDFSNSYFFEKGLSWSGICIEPNITIFKKLQTNRNCICLNCCVGEATGVNQFLSVTGYAVMLSGLLSMFDRRHLERIDEAIKVHGGTKEILDIPVLPLETILENHKIEIVDYCNIDVEGGELGVLKSINFSKVKIKLFSIENNYGEKEVQQFLKLHGYRLIAKLGADEFYELNSKRYLLMLKLEFRKFKNYLNALKNIKLG